MPDPTLPRRTVPRPPRPARVRKSCGCPPSPVTCANAATTSSSRCCAAARTWRRRRPRPCRRWPSAPPAGPASSARSPRVDASVLQVLEAVVALGEPGPVTAADLPAALGATDDAGVALVERALRLAVVGTLVYPDSDAADAPLLPSPGPRRDPRPVPGRARAGRRRHPPRRSRGAGRPRRPADAPRRRPDRRAPGARRAAVGSAGRAAPRPTAPPPRRPSTGCSAATCSCPATRATSSCPARSRSPCAAAARTRAPAFPPPAARRRPAPQPRRWSPPSRPPPASGSCCLVARLVRALGARRRRACCAAAASGVRELRRVAPALETDEPRGRVRRRARRRRGPSSPTTARSSPSFAPTVARRRVGRARRARPLGRRWPRTWLATLRTPWLVGGARRARRRARRARPRAAAPWAPRLRRSVLDVLAETPPGTALDADARRSPSCAGAPRASVPPPRRGRRRCSSRPAASASSARARCPTPAARCCWRPRRWSAPGAADRRRRARRRPAARRSTRSCCRATSPASSPAGPAPSSRTCSTGPPHVESRGGALTVRFTPDVRARARSTPGATADGAARRAGRARPRRACPQPLEYLVRDAARRHGRLRVGVGVRLRARRRPGAAGRARRGPAAGARSAWSGSRRPCSASQAPARELLDGPARARAGAGRRGAGRPGACTSASTVRRGRASRRGAGARRRASGAAPAAAPARPLDATTALLGAWCRSCAGPSAEREADAAGAAAGRGAAAAGPAPRRRRRARRAGARGREQPTPSTRWCCCARRRPRRPEVWVELVGSHGVPQRRLLRPAAGRGRPAARGRRRARGRADRRGAPHRRSRVHAASTAPEHDDPHHQETS